MTNSSKEPPELLEKESAVVTPLLKKSSSSSTVVPFRQTGWRWVALILINLLVLGDFVAIDNPQPLQTQMETILKIDQQQYSLLYSIWALPSIIVPFFGGYLTDKLGVRPALFIFSLALTIGQTVYAYGGYVEDFNWMLVGRAIYAIGSDPLNVAQIVITNKWFQGNEVGVAMALGTMTCGIGRGINSYLVPKLYEVYNNLYVPMGFSALVCVFAQIATILMIILDRIADKRTEIESPTFVSSGSGSIEAVDEENLSLKDIKYFKTIVWLLIGNFAITNAIFFSFNAFTNDLYYQRYQFTNSQAGTIISLSFVVMSISSIFFGRIVDLYGKRASLILYNSFLGVGAFAYFFIVPSCDQCYSSVIPQIMFGLLIGINDAATFPSLPLILEEKYLGTGYGLFFVLQNILVLVLPPAGAFIQVKTASEDDDGFFWMFVFFGALSVVTVVESFMLFFQDRKMDYILNNTVVGDEFEDSSEEGSFKAEGEDDIKTPIEPQNAN